MTGRVIIGMAECYFSFINIRNFLSFRSRHSKELIKRQKFQTQINLDNLFYIIVSDRWCVVMNWRPLSLRIIMTLHFISHLTISQAKKTREH